MSALSPRALAWNAALTASPGALDLHVEASRIAGVIPQALRGGRLLSNGPGWTKIGDRLAHPFDGHGYVRAFHFEADGSVRLRGRFVQTEVYGVEAAAGKLLRRGLGTNVGDHFWQNLGAGGGRNVANTTIVPWAGRLLAGWEGGAPHALDPDTLETRGLETFGGGLPVDRPTLAHMRHDVQAKRLVLLTLGMGRNTKLTFREVDEAAKVVETREAEVPGALFAHDFWVTPRWYVLAANPLKMKFGELAKMLLGGSTLIRCLETNDEAPGALHLIPRGRPGPVRTVTLPGHAFVVHFGNAFEQVDRLIVDACLFPGFTFGAEFGFDGPHRPLDPALPDVREPQRLHRITVAESATEATWERLAAHGVDFPRIHPLHEGVETPRLFAATRADLKHSDPFDAVFGLHLADLGRPPDVWSAKEDVFLGEPLFAPSAEHADRGHVLVVASEPERSALLVFDAGALAAGPVATVPLPQLPYGFHGHWEGPQR